MTLMLEVIGMVFHKYFLFLIVKMTVNIFYTEIA